MTPPPARPPLPVTIIGGYLGAGKTTLVNHLLRQADGLRLAILVNEFGDLAIDPDLIESQDDDVINIAGGCVCCSYGSDLMASLMDLAEQDPAPDHLLIEASGVALPEAIAQSVGLIARYSVEGIAVLVDAETVRAHGRDPYLADTIERQLAAADVIVLNKTDLVEAEELAGTRRWLAERAPGRGILETVRAQVPLGVLIGGRLDRTLAERPRADAAHHHTEHGVAVVHLDEPMEPEDLARRLASEEAGLVRSKGFVEAGDGRLWCVQTVGRRWSVDEAPSGARQPGDIVCISQTGPVDADSLRHLLRTG